MPDVLIEVRGRWLGQRKQAFIEAVHAAMVDALRIPQHDRVLRLIEHDVDSFMIPPNRGEKFTRIELQMFAGRSAEAKRKLYRCIVERLQPFGVPGDDIKIALIEIPLENWGIRGGMAASDIDLGFEVKV
jgi:phenylpyruvate tautomerase PptA (4-oxalocrotonate tautomerase family)